MICRNPLNTYIVNIQKGLAIYKFYFRLIYEARV
jgi:hypothetical protein